MSIDVLASSLLISLRAPCGAGQTCPVFFGVIGFAVPKYNRAMHRFILWRDAMQAAPSPDEVVRVIQEYVTTIPPEVLALLPEECQRALKDPDVQAAAVTILHCELAYRGDPFEVEALHEIAHTYAAASLRITRFSKNLTAQG